MLIRAIMGAFVGTTGSFMTFLAALLLAWSVCGPESESCTADTLGPANTVFFAALLVGVAGMALLYVGLLKLSRQPRPWSVVVPGMVLSIVPFTIPGIWELSGALYLPGAAFAVAGLITGFGPWRESCASSHIDRPSSSPHGVVTGEPP